MSVQGRTTLDAVSSQRIDALRFPLMALVVFLHSFSSAIYAGDQQILNTTGYGADYYIRYFGSNVVARIAVPLYFVFAGYFLQQGTAFSWDAYRGKLKTRVNTLLVPHVFWTLLIVLLFLAFEFAPGASALFSGNNERVSAYDWFDYIDAVFGITGEPKAYQFWFTRDLMALVILWPVLYFGLRWTRLALLAPLAILWFFQFFPDRDHNTSSVLFFTLGVALAMKRIDLFALDRFGPWIVGLYILAIAGDMISLRTPYYYPVHDTAIILGGLSALYATKFIVKSPRLLNWLLTLSPASFFIFATHEPLLTLTRKIIYKMVKPESGLTLVAIYILLPTILIAGLVMAFFMLRRLTPRLLSFVTGARQSLHQKAITVKSSQPS